MPNTLPQQSSDLLLRYTEFLSKLGDKVEYVEYFEERAAILEYDGGLSRANAEKQAFDEAYRKYRRDVAERYHVKPK